jgi:hypothetical protein
MQEFIEIFNKTEEKSITLEKMEEHIKDMVKQNLD